MADEEPAPVLTLKERIAALKLAQAADNSTSKERPRGPNAPKPPPPAPRRQVSSPAAAYNAAQPECRAPNDCGPKASKAAPATAPPPNWENRKGNPPSLPPRRPSQQTTADRPPALPPRRPSELSVSRKQSNESISSVMSGRSSVSAISTRTSFSTASESNANAGSRLRLKAPEYDPAKLPALPERRSNGRAAEPEQQRAQLRPTASSNTISRIGQAAIQSPPSLPARRQAPSAHQTSEMAPSRSGRSALELGFNNAASPPPIPSNRPQQPVVANTPYTPPAPYQGPLVVELDAYTFDDIILRSGKPAFVDFYAPFCKYCKELDPVYDELAVHYQNENITIAKIDSYGQKVIGEKYQIDGWPKLKFFDGTGGPPVDYQWSRDIEWMSRFIDEQMAAVPAMPMAAPPVPLASRPVF